MSAAKSLGDFDVITGPPAPPAVLQRPTEPLRAPKRQPATPPVPPIPNTIPNAPLPAR